MHVLAKESFRIDDPAAHTHWWCRPHRWLLARISERTGVSVVRLRRMTFEGTEPAYRDDEAAARFAGRRYDAAAPAHRAYRFAVCGPCLKHDAIPYLRTPWLIGWMAACPHHGTILIERCSACHARLRVARFATPAAFSPASCSRCGVNLLDGADVPAHPAVMRVQTALWHAKREGLTELAGLGVLTWKEIVALADVLIGTVYTDLTLAELDRLFRAYLAETSNVSRGAEDIFEGRHGSLWFLAWLIEGWPDSPGAAVGRKLIARWLTADRNRLCRHLRPSADPWTQGPDNFEPPIRERLRALAGVPIARADSATPEVLIRIVSAGSNSLQAIQQHVDDLQNAKHRALETDDGDPIEGKAATKQLLYDWDLDLEEGFWRQPYVVPNRRTAPKLVHKLVFSMPPGTPPEKLLSAVRSFAREEFGFTRRYALALHTDEPHPHVHVVVKAMSEEGRRLNIRKPMLHTWRQAFVRHLHSQGVAAMATRGRGRRESRKLRGLHRPAPSKPAVP